MRFSFFFFAHPFLLAHDAFAHHAAGLEDELHPAFRVRFLANQGAAAGPGFGFGLLVGVLAEAVHQAAARLAVGVVLAGAFVYNIKLFDGERPVAMAAAAEFVFRCTLHR